MLGMLAFQMKDVLGQAALRAVRDVGAAGGVLRRLVDGRVAHGLLLLIYAVGLAGVAADAAGVQGGVSRLLAPWAQLSFSLYLLHPIALKIALNWVGLGMWGLNGDAMRLWCLAWMMLLIPIAYLSLVASSGRRGMANLAKLGKR
jgi:peptidoglycan/LPS O-acetylase OafA/YrhL